MEKESKAKEGIKGWINPEDRYNTPKLKQWL